MAWFMARNQKKRVLDALNGELGNTLKNRLPGDAIVYSVSESAICWQKGPDEEEIISFSSLGYERIPKPYPLLFCQWIRNNVVYDSDEYYSQPMTYTRERYVESNKYTVKKDYAGNLKIRQNPGKYVTSRTTIGYAVVRNGYDFEGNRISTGPLKKW